MYDVIVVAEVIGIRVTTFAGDMYEIALIADGKSLYVVEVPISFVTT